MTHVMCSPWKRTFTLVLVGPLAMFSPYLSFVDVEKNVIFKTIASNIPFIHTITTLNAINKM